MKIALIIVRTLMGLFLLFASVSYFLDFGKPATPPPPAAVTYMNGLAVVHLMTIVKTVELLCGLLFLTGRFATLATVVIFPITINVVLFHAIVAPATIGGAIILLVFNLFLAYCYRKNYTSLFAAN